MIKKFIKAWDLNKEALREYFKSHRQAEYPGYKDLVRLLFDIVINPSMTWSHDKYSTEDIIGVDHGEYQGTLIYILHKDTYQPGVEDYVYTNVYYGSCSGCDTLLAISGYDDELPNEKQVEGYMTLCLHLLQRCVRMKSEFDDTSDEEDD